MDHLLSRKADGPGLLDNIIVESQNGTLLRAEILENESWLTGISFGLGDIVDRCSLVLHDGYYYGINLSAPWVPAVFGQESIELAYIPGPVPEMDRYRTNLQIPGIDILGNLKAGEFGLEWGSTGTS